MNFFINIQKNCVGMAFWQVFLRRNFADL